MHGRGAALTCRANFVAEEPRNIVARLKSRSSARDPSLIQGNYRLQNDRVSMTTGLHAHRSTFVQILIMAKRGAQRSSTGVSTQRRNARDAPTSDIEQIIHMVRRIRPPEFVRDFCLHQEFEICDAGKRKHQQLMWTHYSIKFVNKYVSSVVNHGRVMSCAVL